MRIELESVPASSAVEIVDLVSDDPRVVQCTQESGDDPTAFGIAEVSLALALVLASGSAAAFISSVVYKIRQRFRPFLILDLSGDEPVVQIVNDAPGMRGEILIKQKDGEEARLASTDDSSKIATEVVKALGG